MVTCTHCGKKLKKKDAHYCSYVEYEDAENLVGRHIRRFPLCASCAEILSHYADSEAEDEAGNSVVICGDCASLMAFIDSAEYAADDEEQICKGQKCPEQTEGASADA